jgi:hypothetical protein
MAADFSIKNASAFAYLSVAQKQRLVSESGVATLYAPLSTRRIAPDEAYASKTEPLSETVGDENLIGLKRLKARGDYGRLPPRPC